MSESPLVWVVDDDDSIRWVIDKAFSSEGIVVETFAEARSMLEKLSNSRPQVIVTDVRMPGVSGLDVPALVHEQYPQLPVIVVTAHSDLETTVAAYRGGAFDYLTKPFDLEELLEKTRRALESAKSVAEDSTTVDETTTGIIGDSAAMQSVFSTIGRMSGVAINTLITGESGTGKELVARALHQHSPRGEQPFVALNVAAIPAELIESELFGHEKGAFTGAQERRRGHFELAHNGTLFLDEIGDMPAALQTRLLRVLSDGVFFRVGGHTPVKTDVRIIAATHQNLQQRAERGEFREDLFHRLNVVNIPLPPLRERKQDIPALCRFLMQKAAISLGTAVKTLHPEVIRLFSLYDWPGNVRELENLCHRLTAVSTVDEIRPADLPPDALNLPVSDTTPDWSMLLEEHVGRLLTDNFADVADTVIGQCEAAMIRAALKKTAGNRSEAARALGLGRNTLTRKIQSLGIDKDA